MQYKIDGVTPAQAKLIKRGLSPYFPAGTFDNDMGNAGAILFFTAYGEVEIQTAGGTCLQSLSLPIKGGQLTSALRQHEKNAAQKQKMRPIKLGQFEMDPSSNQLFSASADPIALTDKEFEILHYLYQQKGDRVTRDKLLHHVWGYGKNVETHTVETHIYRLRQKIETDPANPAFLMTDEKGYFLNL
jgi:DNA-binding response OmpR family regulator